MTFPLDTLAAQIDATGISAPSYADILASLQASFRAIYGEDTYLGSDSQDGQLLAIFAAAINDANNASIAVYNSFSPSSAQGAGLSSVVKINGLRRLVPSLSTVDVAIVGQTGTIINNGVVADTLGQQWLLPSSVTIPGGGSIIVTATAVNLGSVAAAPGTVNQIVTPTRGWQTVTNASSAVAGAPVESDSTLRQRQSVSTSLSAQTPLSAIVAAVSQLAGVQAVQPYENDTGTTDGNGIPGHSIALIVQGGDAIEIATAIAQKKSPGTGTFGSITEIIIDGHGVPDSIKFSTPTNKRVIVSVSLTALIGYVSTTGDAIKAALVAYVQSLLIGGDVYQSKVEAAANLSNLGLSNSFNITLTQIAFFGNSLGTADLTIAYNELATLSAADITLVVS